MSNEGGRRPSKSAGKRAADAVLALADRLIALPPDQCAGLVDDTSLLAAIEDARRLAGTSAGRRQRLYVAKLMRNIDTTPIADALERSQQLHRAEVTLFRRAENWRDELLSGDGRALERFAAAFPREDTGRVAELCRRHGSESDMRRRKHAARELFREVLRCLADAAEG